MDQSLYVTQGGEVLAHLVHELPNATIGLNTRYAEWVEESCFQLMSACGAAHAGTEIIDMRECIPVCTTDAEARSWYMYPFMTEKWNAKGHRVYARRVADVLANRFGGRGL